MTLGKSLNFLNYTLIVQKNLQKNKKTWGHWEKKRILAKFMYDQRSHTIVVLLMITDAIPSCSPV